jgi:hypothetical protein
MSNSILAAAMYEYARQNYEAGGWDVIVECWDNDMIDEYLTERGAYTLADGIKAFEPLVDVWADQQADARNSAF